ncbi:location of vulva defective 1-like isoform X2 [Patiria miniata]|nr:location of vulva defective 1-like isoform X2 [Patiria miniata]
MIKNEDYYSAEALLLHGIDLTRLEMTLPAGQAGNDYLLDIVVYIFDVALGYTTVHLQVQTTLPDIGSLLGTNPSLLLDNILSGDPDSPTVMRKLITLSSVLNEANRLEKIASENPDNSTRTNNTQASSLLAHRTQMRTLMVSTLAEVTRRLYDSWADLANETEDTETWVQAASTVGLLADTPDELSPGTQSLLVDILENVTANLIRVSLFMPRQQYTLVCNDILHAIDGLQQAAVYDKTEADTVSPEEWAMTRDVVTRCDRVEDDMSSSLLHRLYPGDPLLRLRSSKLQLGLWKDPLFNGQGRAKVLPLTRLLVDGFSLPSTLLNSLDSAVRNEIQVESLKTRELSFNPYIWGDNLGLSITSLVKSMEFIDNENRKINVQDAKAPIDVMFYRRKESLGPVPPDVGDDSLGEGELYDPSPDTYQYAVSVQFSSGDTKFCYTLYIPDEEFTHEMQGNVTEGLFRVFSAATRSQHGIQDVDDRDPCVPVTELAVDEDSVVNSFQDFEDDLNATFGIQIAETQCIFRKKWDLSSSVLLNTEQGINLTFEFHLHSCMYWNEKSETWRQDGCRVSSLSTNNVTVCQCNHLTNFASNFVPVNTIDFIYVFTESNLGDNAAVLVVAIGILCLAILLAPLLRWKDKQDLLRWAARPLIDNTCEDTYVYTVSVYTGHAKHSGTRSIVYFDLIGDAGETRDRRLQDMEGCNIPDTGTLNHYLMGVPRSLGPLSCMRIRHDNSGEGHSASWFVYWFEVYDLQTGRRYCFVLNDWLTADSNKHEVPSRSLSLAGHEETLAIQSDFYRIVCETFADHHLWNSLVNRPLPSRFSRVQRLGVCLSLLYLFMITNAMFYSVDSLEGKPVCPSFRLALGPYTLTSQQLYVGAVSSLIVFPINVVIIQIFRRARRSSEAPTLNGKLVEFASQYGQTVGRFQQQGSLPHCSVYLGWFLIFLSVLVGGLFVVLYSLQWGKKRSEAWLISMFTSLFESVLLVEPAKTVLVAVLISCCCGRILRKANFKHPDKFINVDKTSNGSQSEHPNVTSTTTGASNPTWWQKKINTQDIVEQIGRHLLFMVLILAITLMYRQNDAFYMTKAVKDAFLGPKPYFMKIRTFENYWDWTNMVLIPTLYNNETYTGRPLDETEMKFVGETIGFRVGSVRLRQLRIHPNLCVVSNMMIDHGLQDECNVEYTPSSEDTSNHGESWQNRSLP